MRLAEKINEQKQKIAPLIALAQQLAGDKDEARTDEDREKVKALTEMAAKGAQDLAELCLTCGDGAGARSLLAQALSIRPDADLSRRLAEMALAAGDWQSVCTALEPLKKAGLADAGQLAALAGCYKRLGNHAAMVEAYQAALALDPTQPEALCEQAFGYLMAGAFAEGLTLAQKAAEAHPDNLNAQFYTGQALQGLGRLEEAKAAYRRALTLNPAHVETCLLYGMLLTWQAGDPVLSGMEALFARLPQGSDQRVKLGFALAKACHDTKRYDDGFRYLQEANRLRRAQFADYRVEDDLVLMLELEALFTPDWLAEMQAKMQSGDEAPIFIVGLPRSGTSLTEQILASHPDVFGAGELESLSYRMLDHVFAPDRKRLKPRAAITPADLAAAATAYITPVRRKAGQTPRMTDKMPVNFLWVGFIKLMFPRAKIIVTRRNALANGFALYSTYFSSQGMQYSYDLAETARYMAGERRLTAHWQRLFPDDVMELSYEGLTQDQHGETRRLLAFCGLDWDQRCLDFHQTERPILTLSSAQVRKGLYSGVDRKTEHYRPHLTPLIEGLEAENIVF
ncbi:sulfotransferase [Allorhizobium sp. BGMRC 0089]|nr:sulfotransferase [Allorhizobium sonneratiae]